MPAQVLRPYQSKPTAESAGSFYVSMIKTFLNQSGSIVLEVIIALAVIVLALSAVILVSFGSQKMSLDAELSSQAMRLAQTGLERARATARESFDSLVSSSSSEGIYALSVSVTSPESFLKNIISQVTWPQGSVTQHVELTTMVTDWKHALALGSCGLLSGDWQSPQLLGSFDVGGSNTATAVKAVNQKVYLTADDSVSGSADFWEINTVVPQSPQLIGSLNTGPGLRSVMVPGKYAYVANASTKGQLQVIDINGALPILKSSFKLPNSPGAVGESIFYASNRIYLGTLKTTGPEFNVIDVTNPASPSWLGGWEANTRINDIYVHGNYAYLAVPDNEELKVLDISDPAKITRAGGYSAPGGSGNGTSLTISSGTLYMGRSVGNMEFYSLDVSQAPIVTPLSSLDLNTSVDDFVVRDNLVFFATNDADREFQIWNLNNPAAVYGEINFPARATGVDCQGNTMYVSLESHDGLQIIGPSPTP